MIILDTNVISEALKPSRNLTVVAWLDNQSAETLFLAATSMAELLIGIAVMPDGKRKTAISTALDSLITRLFDGRVLPFDHDAAVAYSALVSSGRAQGKIVSMPDGQIGAIASVHGFTVATRDVAPFQALGVPVINPWTTL
ncbi:MAG: type II toxin-antitoxin system VapC family toxin [Candidatus Obscuribacterales bacterium]|jgi:predicted nucleic acid-binding protein|nr:type II toxin-antitoxin system VapC family toxin [Candidatus Obscuribacterales bacterium]